MNTIPLTAGNAAGRVRRAADALCRLADAIGRAVAGRATLDLTPTQLSLPPHDSRRHEDGTMPAGRRASVSAHPRPVPRDRRRAAARPPVLNGLRAEAN